MSPRKKTGIRKLHEGCFEATVCLPGSRNKKRRRFGTELEAVNWRVKTAADIQAGLRSSTRVPTLSVALVEYRAWVAGRRPATAKFTASVCNRLAKVTYLAKPLDRITGQDVERWRRDLAEEGLSSRTVDHYTERCLRLFSLYREWGVLRKDQGPVAKLARENTERVRYLTDEEELALLTASPERLQRVIRWALATGMRKGEIRGLRWSDVDERARVAKVPAPRTKGKRDRIIPLNATALGILGELSKPLHLDLPVFPATGGRRPPDKGQAYSPADSGQGEAGSWWRLDHAFRAARARAVKGDQKTGRPPCPSLADFHFHDLRHTYASRLVMQGADLYAVSKLLGHTDVKLTQRYAHLAPGHLDETVRLLDK